MKGKCEGCQEMATVKLCENQTNGATALVCADCRKALDINKKNYIICR